MSIDLTRYNADFGSLVFSEPEPGILEIVLSNPARLNAADERMHRDLAHVCGPSISMRRCASRWCGGPANISPRAAITR